MKFSSPRIVFLFCALLSNGFFLLSSLGQNTRPNVLFIAVDDLNDWVGFLGGYPGKVHTPNMDRLAERGTAFLNAHTASPVCCPSRAAVMSGQLPSTSGIYDNKQWWKPNLPDLVTIPGYFKDNGYTTAGAGKIFHHTVGNNPPQLWHKFQRLVFHDNPNSKQDKSQYPFTETVGDPPGFPFSGITLYSKEVDWGGFSKPEAEFDDAMAAQFCVDFLAEKQERPFFLACGIFRPHMPWYFPKKYLDLYPLSEVYVPDDLPEDLDDIPEEGKKLALRKYVDMKKTRDAGLWPTAVQHYLASISFADAQVGKLLDALDASPHRDNTIIVLWSDHGWHLGEKQHWHKRTLWDEGTRIPMIVVDPLNGKSGQRSSQPVSTLDIFPTLIDLCGLPPIPNQKLDGASLKSWLKKPNLERKQAAITVDENKHMSARSERYRFIHYKDGTEEFYDHEADPNEWTNQIANSKYKTEIEQLRSQLPKSTAKPGKIYTAYDFNPFTYSWVDKETGQTITGR
jgi:arylsulfatase A-like enzyme